MSDKMRMISAIGLASIGAMVLGRDPIIRHGNTSESHEHKAYRAERRKKKRMQKKSKKANRT